MMNVDVSDVVSAFIGGIFVLVGSLLRQLYLSRKTDAEAEKTEAEARKLDVETELLIAGYWQQLSEEYDKDRERL